MTGEHRIYLHPDGDPGTGAAPAAPAAQAPAAAPAAAPAPAKGDNILGAPTAAPSAPTAADARKYLEGKGQKADDLSKLDDAKVMEAYGKQKATDARAALTASGMKPADLAKLSDADAIKQAEDASAQAKAVPATAAEYKDFAFPDGLKGDDATLGRFKDLAFANKLTQDEAQKFVDLYAESVIEAAGEPYKLWEETQGKWQEAVKQDSEIGGKNYDAMKATCAKLIDSIGGKEAKAIREALIFTGAGNNPDIIRLVYRAAKALTEGRHVAGGPAGGGGGGPKSAAERLYPEQGKPKLGNDHLTA